MNAEVLFFIGDICGVLALALAFLVGVKGATEEKGLFATFCAIMFIISTFGIISHIARWFA
jgi:hypothetical protein